MFKLTYRFFRKTIFNRYVFAALILAAVFIAGISANNKIFAPDLKRLYMETKMVDDQPPVIFIHGVLGSKLRDKATKETLWPGPVSRLLLHNYSDIAYNFNPETLEPQMSTALAYEISDGAAGKDFYGKIVETLGDTGGYKLSHVGEKVDPKHKNYYV